MTFKEQMTVAVGKFVSWTSKTFRLGAGATWPGEIALFFSPNILRSLGSQLSGGIILVAGTNGKTTTSLMIKTILEHEGMMVVHNKSGANLLNGIVSACIDMATGKGHIKADWGVFEVDENSLPIVLHEVSPKAIVLLNLFRDQLDRYGEVDVIAEKWEKALKYVNSDTTLILNADDPLVSFLGKKATLKAKYFGLTDTSLQAKTMEHATDSTFCLFCGARLSYRTVFFSHIGDWYCRACGEKRPRLDLPSWKSPLPGLYNLYNTLASVLTARTFGVPDDHITQALKGFAPAFGRQEEFVIDGKTVKLFLSKNPAGFNASLRTVLECKSRAILLALNDRIPDGRDVSWIWDVDFEKIPDAVTVIVTGDRVYDMAVRIKYTRTSLIVNRDSQKSGLFVEPDIKKAIQKGLDQVKNEETLYILPTYSAMLEIRKVLTGKRIL
ncbi:hypothetical protein A2Z00_03080 [Candidatus Gottesmanbacteria bacterium RBG_13_45_10]|uniref:Lipid II isoglutaminyl synthase (glutamine-hydrolyzing) subunit MurT n=1 Tax=Candidatus Gottesmanbacteria bacterium RBG_13_45_10 TaxID=1798370 RepID=A0A1F5ZJ44_9BACT|nr:MAG: hypothetical protein A2Z00_03080 [Candidatus Gottesmanbacteria bacterium RBG_13_45_10]